MKNFAKWGFVIVLMFNSCTFGQQEKHNPSSFINTEGNTIAERISCPEGFERISTEPNSFAFYLRNSSLKPHQSKVHLYNGQQKWRQDVHVAVLDIDVGKRDLQQCADAVMRLRAEYLYKEKRYEDISFNFTNGFNAKYSKWREGYRIKVSGNEAEWYKINDAENDYNSFRKYLNMVFAYAGSISLENELKDRNFNEMKIGDVLIQGGSPGHAVIIVDMAIHKKNGEKIFLLAQSYMPAQEIHVIKNPDNKKISPWYQINLADPIETPEWRFYKSDLRSF
jgi:hypothetical protein